MICSATNYNLFQVICQYSESGYGIIVLRWLIMKYQRIRDLREDHDWKQITVAKMLNMSQTGYSKYETGENDIPTRVLIELARIYDTSIDYLLGQTSNPKRYE